VRPIGVAWGYHAVEELRAAGAAAIVTDFAELASLLGAAPGGTERA
jgi:phosphoglycolate phosphatase-like HAD superfamily hydrolase